MIQQQLKYYWDWLQQENYKSFYLSFLRVAISCWLLKEVYINWQAMDILYGHSGFAVRKFNFIDRLPGGLSGIARNYMWFIITYVIVIFLNILGIGKWFTALLLFFMVYVLHQLNSTFFNGGDRMARQILLYLIFANSYQYLVLSGYKYANDDKRKFKNLLSNLAAISIMLQLCVAYFAAGLAKLNTEMWWHGEATYYALSMERFMGTPFNKYIVQYKWLDIVSNYAVMLFELTFPFLIWIKKLRPSLLIAGLIFHLSIYILLMIYGFQTVFVLTYGLFLPNKKLLGFVQKIRASSLIYPKKKIRSND